jgi:hypothetical protein
MDYCEIHDKEGWTRAPTEIHGPLSPAFYPRENPMQLQSA